MDFFLYAGEGNEVSGPGDDGEEEITPSDPKCAQNIRKLSLKMQMQISIFSSQ